MLANNDSTNNNAGSTTNHSENVNANNNGNVSVSGNPATRGSGSTGTTPSTSTLSSAPPVLVFNTPASTSTSMSASARTPTATRSYVSRSTAAAAASNSKVLPQTSRTTRTLSRQSKVHHSIIKSGVPSAKQPPQLQTKSLSNRPPPTSLPRHDGVRSSKKSDESRQTIGGGTTSSKSSATAASHLDNVDKTPANSFQKDILATYQVFNRSKRLDRLLRKFAEFQFLKSRRLLSTPAPPVILPPSTSPSPSITLKSDVVGGTELTSRTSMTANKQTTCDIVHSTVNKKIKTSVVDHFVNWRKRQKQSPKNKKPKRSSKTGPQATGTNTKDTPAFRTFINKQNPIHVKHLRRLSILIDSKDQERLLREVFGDPDCLSELLGFPPMAETMRIAMGPPYIPIDYPISIPTSSKGSQSSKGKSSTERQSSSSGKASNKFIRDSTGISSSPPVIIFPAPHEITNLNKTGGHGHKPVKKFNDKMRAEASVIQRMQDLARQGLIYDRRMPKLVEPSRIKCQWDYLLEEMRWMANDFAFERKWKGAASRKCARMVEKYWKDKEELNKKIEKDKSLLGRKVASFIAKEIRNFWSNVQRLVEYKELAKIEELRKQTVNLHLSMMVDQTEKFADMVATSLSIQPETEGNITQPMNEEPSVVEDSSKMEISIGSDDDFKPDDHESDDDEETIAKAEEEAKDVGNEIDLLAKESTQDLYEIYPRWLVNKMKGIQTEDDEPGSSSVDQSSMTADESEDASDETSSTEGSSDTDEEDDADNDVAKDEEEQTWGLTALIETFSPEKAAPTNDHDQELNSVTELAQSFQPTGCTLSSTQVKTKVPTLLKHKLREYQHVGLDWLVTMCEKKLNGILADEMGLGKTIQTIALLAHLACEKGNWGPHLIIVPTSVMLNWEMEFKKWCPGFKILTYYGSMKERKLKRKGWTKPNTFHVCITSYKLVVQDHHVFRRKAWKYLILDEAQNIKNFKSQRWQLLLNFNSRRRLLLTGTPLQNNLMELWSLLHFLMPNVFQSHREFREWFSNPVSGMVEGSSDYNENIIRRLHKVLRPFILRRLKSEVEKQLPQKFEHVVLCHLSKRQRYLYEEFMSRTRTRETLASGNLLSVINVLMQLRKVCNHPNLFESRPIISPLRTEGISVIIPSLIFNMIEESERKASDFPLLNQAECDLMLGIWNASRVRLLAPPQVPFKFAGKCALDDLVTYFFDPAANGTKGLTIDKNNTVEFTDVMYPGSPRSRSTLPMVLVSSIDPTEYFNDGEFFSALYREADRINKGQHWKPRIKTPSPTKRRVTLDYNKIFGRPAKISKLSTGQIELFQTTTGKHAVVLTGSTYANGLCTSTNDQSSDETNDQEPVLVDAEPLAYNSSFDGTNVSNDTDLSCISTESGSSEDSERREERERLLEIEEKKEPYTRPKKPIKHLSELAAMTYNERTAHVEFNPFFHFRNQLELKANIVLSQIELSTRMPENPRKRKLLDDENSDENEDSEESVTSPPISTGNLTPPSSVPNSNQSSPTKVMTSNMYRSSKREFRPEDADLDSSMFRSLKRREVPKFDAKAGLTWMRDNGVDPTSFTKVDVQLRRLKNRRDVIVRLNKTNIGRCKVHPFFGYDTLDACKVFSVPHAFQPYRPISGLGRNFEKNGYFKLGYAEVESYRLIKKSAWNRERNHPTNKWRFTQGFINAIATSENVLEDMIHNVLPSVIYIPSVETPSIRYRVFRPFPSLAQRNVSSNIEYDKLKDAFTCLHPISSRMATQFPDPRLIQYDCGKLQKLDLLLRRLSNEDHRVLIFTQMTKMLDVLEAFLNYHGYIYLRLDGSTKIEQRQLLMEKFNTDRRIFCFILSTRSGGIGVNLTGADTVIFYDSDWNPTMDAQAQDRCHRIGQTRDVHIYRMVSEKTVEENILLKSNQKRLLGELAIEGGNFTTAFFKKNTIRDLFDTEVNLLDEQAEIPPTESDKGKEEDKTKSLLLESALASAEDETDVQAARTVRAEAAAELAEFDETIPLDTMSEEQEIEEPPSAAATELEIIMSELTKIERYAFLMMESTIHEWTSDTYESAAKVVENQKKQWEVDQLALNEQNTQPTLESSDDEEIIMYSASDAQNKVWMAQSFESELMPIYEPPTPPVDDTDVYIDSCFETLYYQEVIPEHELPPVYVPPLKKKAMPPKATTIPGYPPLIPSPTQMDISTDQKKLPLKTHKREEPIFAPKSLFERPNPQVNKLRRDFKLQKHNRPAHVSPPSLPPIPKPVGPDSVSFPVVSPPMPKGISVGGLDNPTWHVQEEDSLVNGIANYCELPASLMVVSPAQTANWDFISENVNQASITHRSPKLCKSRYEAVVGPREEGKMIFDSPSLVKKKKSKAFVKLGPPSPQRARPQIKTAQLLLQENFQKYTEVFVGRFEAMRNLSMRKLNQTLSKPPGAQKVAKQSLIFTEHGINYDTPTAAAVIAHARLERIQLERRKAMAAQEAARLAAQEAARIAAAAAAAAAQNQQIGTITLPAGQTLSVQGGVQQSSNPLYLQTLPQKLTPAQMEILKQNLAMSAQLRQNQLSGTLPIRQPYQRAPDPAVSVQGVKRIQVVPNSVQSTLGGVSFAITSSTATTTAQQTTIIPFSQTISGQNSPIIQSQLQSSNIPPGTIYQRNQDALSVHNVKRIQVVPNSIQASVGGVTFAITTPTSSNIAQQQNIITLNTTVASQLSSSNTQPQMLGPLPPVSVFQRGADALALQGVKRIQVVSNAIQQGGITFAVSTTAPTGASASTPHSLISISASIASVGGPANTGQGVQVTAPIITMAQVAPVVSTVQSLGTLLSSSTTSPQPRFQNIQGSGTPLAAFVKSPTQKPGQPQTFITSNMQLGSLNTLRPVIVRPRTYSPQQQIQSLQMQQLSQQQQAQIVVSSGTSQHSIFTLSSPITSTGQNTQRVTLVHQAPVIPVSGQPTQAQPIIAVPSSQISSLTSTTASNLQARLQSLPMSTSGPPVATLLKGSVAPKLPSHTYISTPIQYTSVRPGTTTQAQMPTQLIVQTTSKQLPASLQQFQQVFKQVIFRQPVQILQGQPVAVSLGGTLARPVVSQGVPIRTSVPISAIAHISTGPPQAQTIHRRLPLTLPLNTSAAPPPPVVASSGPEPALVIPARMPASQPMRQPPIIPNISKEEPPVNIIDILMETPPLESNTPKPSLEDTNNPSGTSQG